MKLFDQLKAYLIASKEEFRKVSWPTRPDTIRYSLLVIGVSVFVAVFFATLDYGFTELTSVAVSARAARVQSPSAAPLQGSAPLQVDTTPVTNSATTPKLDLGDIKVNATPTPAPAPAPAKK